jgi:hypothetical protein
MTDEPILPRRRQRQPKPEEERFRPTLAVPALDAPRRQRPDPIETRRARAEHLCLWMGCTRVLCRNSRRCLGRNAMCVFEQADVERPLLDALVESTTP